MEATTELNKICQEVGVCSVKVEVGGHSNPKIGERRVTPGEKEVNMDEELKRRLEAQEERLKRGEKLLAEVRELLEKGRAVLSEEAAERLAETIPSDHEMLFHFGIEEMGSPGAVLDEATARATPCSCFTYKGKDLCWSKGIVGMLTQPQQEVYCVAGKAYKARPALTERYRSFAAAAEEAHKKIEAMPSGMERLETWLSEMGKELSKRGIEV